MISQRPMKTIPIKAGRAIAEDFGYDQVIIIARRVGEDPLPNGEHVTTYGRNKTHCDIAAQTGNFIKHKIMGWPHLRHDSAEPLYKALKKLHAFGEEQRNRLGAELAESGPGRDLYDEVVAALKLYEEGQS